MSAGADGVIGKRVADAVATQQDMVLAGVCDVIADARMAAATAHDGLDGGRRPGASIEPDGASSMAKTDAALGIGGLLPALQ
jgi:glyceraldehyde-3-phosphate dehydrogenase/erythrose-4-phosphate dehydrogenase